MRGLRRVLAVVAAALLPGFVGLGPAAGAPATESATSGITQLEVGHFVACARRSDGTARCWGSDAFGSLGNGPAAGPVGRPVTVVAPSGVGPLTGVAEIATGLSHACARLTTGQVRCWGSGANGALGNGATADQSLPVVVTDPTGAGPLVDVVDLSAGWGQTCALLSSGQARCWGNNGYGQLGDGSLFPRVRPVAVRNPTDTGPLTGVARLTAGHRHTCARLVSGQVRCWGDNVSAQLGAVVGPNATLPVPVVGVEGDGPLDGVTQVSAGWDHTCARRTDATAVCWGDNSSGQLGDGTEEDADVPTVVQDGNGDADLTGVLEVSAGSSTTCARRTGGTAECWGSGAYGALGRGRSFGFSALPAPVRNVPDTGPLANVAGIDVGTETACARLRNGQARCWGFAYLRVLGNGSDVDAWTPVVVFRR